MTSLGCFSSAGDMSVFGNAKDRQYMSWGRCTSLCTAAQMPVMGLTIQGATTNQYCYCGKFLPPKSDQISSAQCGTPCNAWTQNQCGGQGSWNVLLTGVGGNPGYLQGGSSDSSSDGTSDDPPTSAPTGGKAAAGAGTAAGAHATSAVSFVPSTVTLGGSTIVETIAATGSAPTSSSSGSSGSSGGSKAGIAAGVVVGLVALAAIIGGIFLYLRHRRRKQIEAEHRRQSSITAFAPSRNPHMSALPANDSRLDPIIAARRQSDGSIADNQDYSRRVLKVTNPDDRW